MSLRARLQGALPVTAPLVLNPLMARMVEAADFPAGYLDGGASGYAKVALEADLNPDRDGPLMYLAGRGGLAGSGLTLKDLGGLGYKIVADPPTPLLAVFVAWKK